MRCGAVGAVRCGAVQCGKVPTKTLKHSAKAETRRGAAAARGLESTFEMSSAQNPTTPRKTRNQPRCGRSPSPKPSARALETTSEMSSSVTSSRSMLLPRACAAAAGRESSEGIFGGNLRRGGSSPRGGNLGRGSSHRNCTTNLLRESPHEVLRSGGEICTRNLMRESWQGILAGNLDRESWQGIFAAWRQSLHGICTWNLLRESSERVAAGAHGRDC